MKAGTRIGAALACAARDVAIAALPAGAAPASAPRRPRQGSVRAEHRGDQRQPRRLLRLHAQGQRTSSCDKGEEAGARSSTSAAMPTAARDGTLQRRVKGYSCNEKKLDESSPQLLQAKAKCMKGSKKFKQTFGETPTDADAAGAQRVKSSSMRSSDQRRRRSPSPRRSGGCRRTRGRSSRSPSTSIESRVALARGEDRDRVDRPGPGSRHGWAATWIDALTSLMTRAASRVARGHHRQPVDLRGAVLAVGVHHLADPVGVGRRVVGAAALDLLAAGAGQRVALVGADEDDDRVGLVVGRPGRSRARPSRRARCSRSRCRGAGRGSPRRRRAPGAGRARCRAGSRASRR